MLGNTTGNSSAALLIGGAFTVARTVTVQNGNTGTITLGGSTADTSIFSGTITLNKALNLTVVSGGTVSFSACQLVYRHQSEPDSAGAGNVTVSGTITTGTGTVTKGQLRHRHLHAQRHQHLQWRHYGQLWPLA